MSRRNSSPGGPRAIVLLSGGLDSTVALYWTLAQNYSSSSLTFDYYRRGRKEVLATRNISKKAGCDLITYDLPFLKEVSDVQPKTTALMNAPSGYIPARNIIFYGLATYLAELSNSEFIVGGHNKDDPSLFGDSSSDFFEQFNVLSEVAMFTGKRYGRVVLPLAKLTKTGVIGLGKKLGVPFELTWSCQTNREEPCAKCRSCRLRAVSFEKAGFKDPLMS